MKTKIIVVLGPTAVGKTALGIDLAQRFNGEIISGDSQQVYRQLDIGTAKASQEEQTAAVHHLIDVREVTDGYSAFDFVQEAQVLIEEIVSRGKVPIIVGGTGLYLQSLLEGYHLGGEIDQEAVLAYRGELEKLADEELFRLVEKEGLLIAQLNRRRAIRGLELKKFGKDLENREPAYDALVIGLSDERQVLYDRINERVDKMMKAGLLAEAKWLYEAYPDCQAARGIGYKELFPYFSNQQSLEEVTDTLKQATRRFAKRQLTWFRNRMKVDFYHISEPGMKEQIIEDVEAFLHD
ncbi:tRNA dimethylallyltransferase [Streptococcus gallinaceus]|uniref:tRNA (adenosine(37)-N6)-dimethylallyltransferase MiaA n=1 Tax=Streptococcus gallinaceus TaxID=165758 RepID=UPI0020A01BFA|nr:tRNA (adenosine(37)-N6)-dimethylallyltransferase MiaA [Streptococcus gallinaceus]MCP1638658.1 tRNA dimethylallyltransferase [Streptococcus gallinaceus]MCP1769255.1 tRNA dimethylallyltransferase [Streptococcus gallinaceus]